MNGKYFCFNPLSFLRCLKFICKWNSTWNYSNVWRRKDEKPISLPPTGFALKREEDKRCFRFMFYFGQKSLLLLIHPCSGDCARKLSVLVNKRTDVPFKLYRCSSECFCSALHNNCLQRKTSKQLISFCKRKHMGHENLTMPNSHLHLRERRTATLENCVTSSDMLCVFLKSCSSFETSCCAMKVSFNGVLFLTLNFMTRNLRILVVKIMTVLLCCCIFSRFQRLRETREASWVYAMHVVV